MYKIKKLSGISSIDKTMMEVELFLESPVERVFFFTGYFGIGKRTALRKLFEKKRITPVEHDYTVIKTAEPIRTSIEKHPDRIHLWDDVFKSNLMFPEMMQLFHNMIENRTDNKFSGKFILVANDAEFYSSGMPDLPGVHIQISEQEIFDIHQKRRQRINESLTSD